jgi:hypothetical protein
MRKVIWVEEAGQKVWLWIGVVFAAFYFGEAFLFWGPNPRVNAPSFTPLVYWGAFGAAVIGLLLRQPKQASEKPAPGVPHALQTWVLGVGITVSVVGMAFLVMWATGNVTLGHAILLGAMFEAGVVIGGMSGNLGWLAAGIVWAGAAVHVLRYPSTQDITIGIATATGFALVGLIRLSAREAA